MLDRRREGFVIRKPRLALCKSRWVKTSKIQAWCCNHVHCCEAVGNVPFQRLHQLIGQAVEVLLHLPAQVERVFGQMHGVCGHGLPSRRAMESSSNVLDRDWHVNQRAAGPTCVGSHGAVALCSGVETTGGGLVDNGLRHVLVALHFAAIYARQRSARVLQGTLLVPLPQICPAAVTAPEHTLTFKQPQYPSTLPMYTNSC